MKRCLVSMLGYVLLTTAALAQGLTLPGPGLPHTTGGGGNVPTYLSNNSGSHQNGNVSTTTVAVTLPAAVASGAMCVVTLTYLGSIATASVTDDKSNAYTVIDSLSNPTAAFSTFNFYALNITNAPQTITATYANNAFGGIQVDCFSNVATTNALDGHAMVNVNAPTNTANSVSAGPITTTAAGDLIYSNVFDGASAGLTPGTGFTSRQAVVGTYFSETLIQSSAGSISGTWTPVTSGASVTTVYVLGFKHL